MPVQSLENKRFTKHVHLVLLSGETTSPPKGWLNPLKPNPDWSVRNKTKNIVQNCHCNTLTAKYTARPTKQEKHHT